MGEHIDKGWCLRSTLVDRGLAGGFWESIGTRISVVKVFNTQYFDISELGHFMHPGSQLYPKEASEGRSAGRSASWDPGCMKGPNSEI